MISYAQFQTFIERYVSSLLFFLGVVIGYFVEFPDESLFVGVIAIVGGLLCCLTGIVINSFLSVKAEIADILRKRGFYKILMKYGNVSLLLCLSLVLVGIFGFFISECCKGFYNSVVFGFLFSACGAFYRLFWLLLKIGGFSKV